LATTGVKRSQAFPAVPTLKEAGVDVVASAWFGLFVPAGTPPAAVARLHAETAKILAQADVRERLAALGFEPVGGTQQEFAAYLKKELDHWARVVKETGAKAE